jgi:hypothetical protein
MIFSNCKVCSYFGHFETFEEKFFFLGKFSSLEKKKIFFDGKFFHLEDFNQNLEEFAPKKEKNHDSVCPLNPL